jgi:hypothetical protein
MNTGIKIGTLLLFLLLSNKTYSNPDTTFIYLSYGDSLPVQNAMVTLNKGSSKEINLRYLDSRRGFGRYFNSDQYLGLNNHPWLDIQTTDSVFLRHRVSNRIIFLFRKEPFLYDGQGRKLPHTYQRDSICAFLNLTDVRNRMLYRQILDSLGLYISSELDYCSNRNQAINNVVFIQNTEGQFNLEQSQTLKVLRERYKLQCGYPTKNGSSNKLQPLGPYLHLKPNFGTPERELMKALDHQGLEYHTMGPLGFISLKTPSDWNVKKINAAIDNLMKTYLFELITTEAIGITCL